MGVRSHGQPRMATIMPTEDYELTLDRERFAKMISLRRKKKLDEAKAILLEKAKMLPCNFPSTS